MQFITILALVASTSCLGSSAPKDNKLENISPVATAYSRLECADWRFNDPNVKKFGDSDGTCNGYVRWPVSRLASAASAGFQDASCSQPGGDGYALADSDKPWAIPSEANVPKRDPNNQSFGKMAVVRPAQEICMRWFTKSHVDTANGDLVFINWATQPEVDPTQAESMTLVSQFRHTNCINTADPPASSDQVGTDAAGMPCGGCFTVPNRQPGVYLVRWRSMLNQEEWSTSYAEVHVKAATLSSVAIPVRSDNGLIARGNKLFLDGELHKFKGYYYSTYMIGQNGFDGKMDQYSHYFMDLHRSNLPFLSSFTNVIRGADFGSSEHSDFLTLAEDTGMKVIATFGFERYELSTESMERQHNKIFEDFGKFIENTMNSNAVVMWCLSDLSDTFTEPDKDLSHEQTLLLKKLFNSMIALIREKYLPEMKSNKLIAIPFATATFNEQHFQDFASLDFDVWILSVAEQQAEVIASHSPHFTDGRPALLQFSAPAFHFNGIKVNPMQQAKHLVKVMQLLEKDDRFAGGLIVEFNDQWFRSTSTNCADRTFLHQDEGCYLIHGAPAQNATEYNPDYVEWNGGRFLYDRYGQHCSGSRQAIWSVIEVWGNGGSEPQLHDCHFLGFQWGAMLLVLVVVLLGALARVCLWLCLLKKKKGIKDDGIGESTPLFSGHPSKEEESGDEEEGKKKKKEDKSEDGAISPMNSVSFAAYLHSHTRIVKQSLQKQIRGRSNFPSKGDNGGRTNVGSTNAFRLTDSSLEEEEKKHTKEGKEHIREKKKKRKERHEIAPNPEVVKKLYEEMMEHYFKWCKKQGNKEKRKTDTAGQLKDLLVFKTLFSLAEGASHSPTRLFRCFHTIGEKDSHQITIDLHQLHGGLREMNCTAAPVHRQPNFDDMDDAITNRKTYRESPNLFVILDIIRDNYDWFYLKVWLFELAYALFVFYPTKSIDDALNWVQLISIIDCGVEGVTHLTVGCYGRWQKCPFWRMLLVRAAFHLLIGAGIVVTYMLEFKEIVILCLSFEIVKPLVIIFSPRIIYKNRRDAWSINLKSAGFWILVLLFTLAFEIFMVAPMVASLEWTTFCPQSCAKQLSWGGFASNSCVSCSAALVAICLLVFILILTMDAFMIFQLLGALFGFFLARGVENARTSIQSINFSKENQVEDAFGAEKAKVLWQKGVDSLRRRYLIGDTLRNELIAAMEDKNEYKLDKCSEVVREKISWFLCTLEERKQALNCNTGANLLVSPPPLISVMIPCFNETVLHSSEDLKAVYGGMTTLEYIRFENPQEWKYFRGDHWTITQDDYDNHDVRIWASLHSQTLARTLIGFSSLFDAFSVHCADSNTVEIVIACQLYDTKDEIREDLETLLKIWEIDVSIVYPIEKRDGWKYDPEQHLPDITRYRKYRSSPSDHLDHRKKLESCLPTRHETWIDKWKRGVLDSHDQIARMFPLRLGPDNAPKTQGKAGNQLNGLRAVSGDYLFVADSNMDMFFWEAVKLPAAIKYILKPGTGINRMMGCRETIYTARSGLIGRIVGESEFSFTTIYQRVLARILDIRMHYGHGDIISSSWVYTHGTLSKASKTINLSEDFFTGLEFALQEGCNIFTDFVELEKGREVVFLTYSDFLTKISCGSVGILKSRQMMKYYHGLSFLRAASHWISSNGFYVNLWLTDISMRLYLIIFLLLSLGGVSLHHLGEMDNRLASVWILSMGLSSLAPLFAELMCEYDPYTAVFKFARDSVPSTIFFIFQNRTLAHAFENGVLTGKAEYLSTGRPLHYVSQTTENAYRHYVESHYYPAIRIFVVYFLYSKFSEPSGVYPMYVLLVTAAIWILAPVLANPHPQANGSFKSSFYFISSVGDSGLYHFWLAKYKIRHKQRTWKKRVAQLVVILCKASFLLVISPALMVDAALMIFLPLWAVHLFFFMTPVQSAGYIFLATIVEFGSYFVIVFLNSYYYGIRFEFFGVTTVYGALLFAYFLDVLQNVILLGSWFLSSHHYNKMVELTFSASGTHLFHLVSSVIIFIAQYALQLLLACSNVVCGLHNLILFGSTMKKAQVLNEPRTREE